MSAQPPQEGGGAGTGVRAPHAGPKGANVIQRLTSRIWLIEGDKGGRYPYSHSLYVRDGGGVLIDCGSDENDILRLKKEEGLRTVVMTHYHEDHFFFLHMLPDVEVWATDEDAPALESFETLLDRYGLIGSDWEPFFRKLLSEKFSFRPRTIARKVADGESPVRRTEPGRSSRPVIRQVTSACCSLRAESCFWPTTTSPVSAPGTATSREASRRSAGR